MLRTFLLIMFLSVMCFGQSIEAGWKGIRPLLTDRATVEKMLGPPKKVGVDYPIYETPDIFLQATYTTLPCGEDSLGRGKYSVPDETVLRYDLQFKGPLVLDDLEFEREKYEKRLAGDVGNLRDYYNADDGITITVSIQEEREYVSIVRFGPSRKNGKQFKCG